MTALRHAARLALLTLGLALVMAVALALGLGVAWLTGSDLTP